MKYFEGKTEIVGPCNREGRRCFYQEVIEVGSPNDGNKTLTGEGGRILLKRTSEGSFKVKLSTHQ